MAGLSAALTAFTTTYAGTPQNPMLARTITSPSLVPNSRQPLSQPASSSNVLMSSTTPHISDHATVSDLKTRVLTLANGNLLVIKHSDIPDPPSYSYANDLILLASLWDDSHPSWPGTSPLVIRNTPIALKYWPEVYRNGGDSRWKAIKARWSDWKVWEIIILFNSFAYIT